MRVGDLAAGYYKMLQTSISWIVCNTRLERVKKRFIEQKSFFKHNFSSEGSLKKKQPP